MKLYKRLLSLLLVCFVCFGLFSVNAFAVEEEENLVDSNLENWDNLSEYDTWGVENSKIYPLNFSYSSHFGAYSVYLDTTLNGSFNYDMYGGICELTDLVVGQRYKFSIDLKCSPSNFTDYFDIFVGVCYFKDGVFYPYDDINMYECSLNANSFTTNSFEFEYSYNGYQPYLFIIQQCVRTYDGSGFRLLLNNVSLSREVTATEKKLDGILGWLEDIKNSIVGLPQTIKNNFQTFFSDLENKINDFKNTVTEKFTTLSTEFSSYITNLGNNIKGFFEYLWGNISEWFEKFKPRIEIPLTFTNRNGYSESDFFIPYSDKFHLQLPYDWYVDVYDLEGNKTNFVGVSANYNYQFLKPYFTEYYQFKIRIYGTGNTEPSSIYVDSGWLTAVFDGFKYQFYSLKIKIELKIEEIKQSLHDLFIPSEGYFNELSNRFDLLIEERFGALVSITDYLVEFFSSFNADNTKEFFDVPIININLMGYNFPIGGWQVRFVPQFNGVEILTNACKFISSVLATFAFFDGLKNKYHEVFGGGE